MSAPRIQNLNQGEQEVAWAIHTVQMAAYAKEAKLLEALHFPPLQRTVVDIQSSPDRFFGAILDGAIVGVLSLESDEETESVDITSLVVAPKHQRQGIGKFLLSTVLADYKNTEITVSTAVKNAPALALYAKFGFVGYQRCMVGSEEPLELIKLHGKAF